MYVLQGLDRFVTPRTELAFPGHQIKMHQNATASPVDHVMADLEDACPYEMKGDRSRRALVEALNTVDYQAAGTKVVTFRPNNIRSRFFLGDLQAVVLGAPDRFHGIVLPKVMEAADVAHVSRLLDSLEQQGGWTTRVQIEALIETPLALLNAYKIATASDRMVGLIFGIADFSAEIGVRKFIEDQNRNFHYAKQHIVVSAKAAGLHAIDNVYFKIVRRDTPAEDAARIDEALRQKNVQAANIGMDGSWIIHPQQAETVNACYTPPDERIEDARQAVEIYHELGGGSMINPKTGEFMDEATIKVMLADLAKAAQAGKIDPAYLSQLAARSRAITGYDVLGRLTNRPGER